MKILPRPTVLVVSMLTLSLFAPAVDALPIYAVTASSECDTCHVEPLGWANPDLSERRCTLDCVGCHVSPAGGGLRRPDGQFYGEETLPIWGDRPSSHADPEKNRPKGFPKEGKYKLGEGFSGWWPGTIDHHTIEDRYGDIDPDPKWRIGGDFRGAVLNVSTEETGETFVFPMQADVYLANESVDDLTVYVSGGLQGYKDTDQYGSADDPRDYFTIRELFMMYRSIYNSWVRAGRIIPRYGWRTADHTAFTRDSLGFDQFFQAFGLDAGVNPNYFYADASFYFQGLKAWPGERLQRGTGGTFNVGWRDLGWQVGSSFHYLDSENSANQFTGGVQWAINYAPLSYYGELDFRKLLPQDEGTRSPNGLYALHKVHYWLTRGVGGKVQYDWADSDIDAADNHRHRITLGVDVHPYTYINLEFLYRLNYGALSPLGSPTDTSSQEALLLTHVWF